MIENIQFKYNEDLVRILMDITENYLTLDSKDAILGNMNNIAGERKMSEAVSEDIKNPSIDWVKMFDEGRLRSNMMLPYVLLYKRLKTEIVLFNKYQKYIEELKKFECGTKDGSV